MKYELIVGNIGMVHTGNDLRRARALYQLYVNKSLSGEGRAAGESVTLFEEGEMLTEYVGPVSVE